MAHAILVGSVTQPLTQQELVAIEGTVDYLRICADRLPARVSSDLNSRFQGDTVFSLRTDTHTTTSRQRIEKLLTAAVQYDLTELDAETDLVGEVLDSIPPSRRIIRWCGPARDWRVLYERFQRLEAIPAKYYVFVTEPSRNGDELVALEFLSSTQRTDVTAYAQGPLGFWTRLLAPQVGAPLVFASVHESATACGEPSVHRLMTDYGFPNICLISELFGIVGKSALQSLFPRMGYLLDSGSPKM